MNNYKPTLIERYIFSPDSVRQRPISSISPTIRFVDYLSLELYSEQSNNYEHIFETFYFSLYKKPFDKWKNKVTQPQTFSLSRLYYFCLDVYYAYMSYHKITNRVTPEPTPEQFIDEFLDMIPICTYNYLTKIVTLPPHKDFVQYVEENLP